MTHPDSIHPHASAVDPRDDFNHPDHDAVCGWCGEIHADSPVAKLLEWVRQYIVAHGAGGKLTDLKRLYNEANAALSVASPLPALDVEQLADALAKADFPGAQYENYREEAKEPLRAKARSILASLAMSPLTVASAPVEERAHLAIGTQVEIIGEYAEDWRGKRPYICRIEASGESVSYTISDTWPVIWPGWNAKSSIITDGIPASDVRAITAALALPDGVRGDMSFNDLVAMLADTPTSDETPGIPCDALGDELILLARDRQFILAALSPVRDEEGGEG